MSKKLISTITCANFYLLNGLLRDIKEMIKFGEKNWYEMKVMRGKRNPKVKGSFKENGH